MGENAGMIAILYKYMIALRLEAAPKVKFYPTCDPVCAILSAKIIEA